MNMQQKLSAGRGIEHTRNKSAPWTPRDRDEMAVVLAGLSEAVEALTDQPADALNNGRRTIAGVTALGDAIVAHHVASARPEFPARQQRAEPRPAPAPEPALEPAHETEAAAPDESVAILLPAGALDRVLAARAAQVAVPAFPAQPASERYGVLVGETLDMQEWREWSELSAAVDEFFAYATAPAPDALLAGEYAGGRIGGQVCVPARLVAVRSREHWSVRRVITATHSGSLRLLDGFDASEPMAQKFRAWLHMLATEYRLRIVYEPRGAPGTEWEDEPDALGHVELYYDAMTLAHLYGLTAVVRGTGRVSAPLADTAPMLERARELVDRYADDGRKTFVFAMEGPDARQAVPGVARADGVASAWSTFLDAELPFASAYEDDVRTAYGMWTQMHRDAPRPAYAGLSLPSGASAIDVHFAAHMRSRYEPHRELPLQVPLASMPLAEAPEPVRMPMAAFALELEAASLEEGTSVTRVAVEESALMDVTYQFAAPAWVAVSYTIPHTDVGAPVKNTQLVDVRLHVAEAVLAVSMAQALARLAADRREELVEGEAEKDADLRALLARALLFHNVCE